MKLKFLLICTVETETSMWYMSVSTNEKQIVNFHHIFHLYPYLTKKVENSINSQELSGLI